MTDGVPLPDPTNTQKEDVALAECDSLSSCTRLEILDRDSVSLPRVVWERLLAVLGEGFDEVQEDAAADDAMLSPVCTWDP